MPSNENTKTLEDLTHVDRCCCPNSRQNNINQQIWEQIHWIYDYEFTARTSLREHS